MRTRTALAGTALIALGLNAGPASAQLSLRGSDTLEEVTKEAIINAGLTASLTYVGGGSGAGENAMLGGTQKIAPMSRPLQNAACVPGAEQLVVGLDGIAVVGGNQVAGDSLDQTADPNDNCSDTISAKTVTGIMKADGVTPCDASDGCSPAGTYVFANWKEVLAMVYGGVNHNTAVGAINSAGGVACTYQSFAVCPASGAIPANCAPGCLPGDHCLEGNDSTCPAGQVCFPNNKCGDPAVVGTRNAGRVNCMNPVRVFLANNYGSIFGDLGTPHTCRNGTCTTLRHAFRRDDLSGTTDTFTGLVGLPGIANPTRAFNNNSPQADRQAAANPFCNAGERPMNKGDSDYLDLDPIRRAVDHQFVGGIRSGLEQVSEFDSPTFGGNNNDATCNALVGGSVKIPQDRASTIQPGIWPDPNIPNSTALLQADLGSNGTGGVLRTTSTRTCLGLVVPVTLPANFSTATQAFFGDASGNPVACDIVAEDGVSNAVAAVIMDTQHSATALCPNGTPQPCLLPYKFDPAVPTTHHNFNCISDQLNPNVVGGYQDRRVFNLHPIDVNGHYVRDNYLNPAIPTTSLSAARQARVVSAYYRLHTTTTTNLHNSVPTGGPCRLFSSTAQIGCLVKANTCSIGFAGREAADDLSIPGTVAQNLAFMIEGVRPTTANIQNLVTGAGTVYPISRALWLNSIGGFSGASAAEQALYAFESVPANIDPIILSKNFTVVPPGVTRLKSCPATFP